MKKVITPKARLSFPKLFTPDDYGKYRATLLIPKTEDISQLKKMLNEAVKEKWPDANKRPPALVNPIKDGDTDVMQDGTLRCDKYPEMKGHWVINCMSKQRPGVVDQQVQPIMEEGEIYAGCFVRASLTCFTYAPTKQNPQSRAGAGFGLQNIQKLADGDAFSGRSRAEDDFAPVDTGSATPSDGVTAASEDDMFA